MQESTAKSYFIEEDFAILDPFLSTKLVSPVSSAITMRERVRKVLGTDLSNLDIAVSAPRCRFAESGIASVDIKGDWMILIEEMVGGYCLGVYRATRVSATTMKISFQRRLSKSTDDGMSCSYVGLVMEKSKGRKG